MTFQIHNQTNGIYQDYLNSGLSQTQTYEQYCEAFYISHPNSHLSYSKAVKNQLRPQMKLDKMRARLRRKLEEKRLKQIEATP